ncbi:MAG TPA: glycine zipper domain-containing protein [Thermodesulfobacteriota bacterium]|nr:glycine zipper domain-containing protein [Thermodesulfobacteriota bacterium]
MVPDEHKGGATGGAVGSATGAAVSDSKVQGAIIGGLNGGLVGGAIGHYAYDKRERGTRLLRSTVTNRQLELW